MSSGVKVLHTPSLCLSHPAAHKGGVWVTLEKSDSREQTSRALISKRHFFSVCCDVLP